MSTHNDLLMPQLRTNFSHPTDVINFLHEQMQAQQACALIVVTGTDGGGVRAPGALAAVSRQGECAGYIPMVASTLICFLKPLTRLMMAKRGPFATGQGRHIWIYVCRAVGRWI